jgi:glucose/arabinose dehydrogenase
MILRMNPDGSGREVYASGIRNSVGFTWHPESKELWFTDNGRDMLGDDVPACELNRAPRAGLDFGFPYCHGGTVADPEFGSLGTCSAAVAPVQNLGPHVAPLAVRFYTGKMFPREYRGQVLIAEHGSWNRSKEAGKTGYRISLVRLRGNKSVSYETFIDGWLDGDDVRGRPVDLLVAPDGSLLVSDDQRGVIYRISYKG